jgi:hypothetical protein
MSQGPLIIDDVLRCSSPVIINLKAGHYKMLIVVSYLNIRLEQVLDRGSRDFLKENALDLLFPW